MRTTLTLDNDIADSLKEQARLLNVPFKRVVNDALRRGLAPGGGQTPSRRFRVVPNESGFMPGVDPLRLNQLSDDLEVEGFIGKHTR